MATNPKDIEAQLSEESPPPAYDSTANNAPPKYTSPDAKTDSDGHVDFCKKLLIILCSTIGCTILIAIVLAIPVTMIVMGAVHKDNCPAERMIPIYLIVGGAFGIVKNLSSLMQRCMNKDKEDGDEQNAKTNPFDSILNCFLFAWFIAGNVWIYRTKDEWTSDPVAANYCDPSLYWFAFWLTTSTYILMGTMCCCICFGGILATCCGAISGEK
ncbi:TM272-like protein [Mya arenaria]|uniref:TM272-like protein n=1 Tax=Mya arenaria TaxID=6604 RepID=A0ABY7DW44_MYAAR|nr:TM272-like protein [Mya arenaria]